MVATPRYVPSVDPLRGPARLDRITFDTKAEALRAFLAVNARALGAVGWHLDQAATGGEFDAVNERYGLTGKRRVTTLRGALYACLPARRGRYSLLDFDLDALNATAIGEEIGGFILPDAVEVARLERKAEYLDSFDYGHNVPSDAPAVTEEPMREEKEDGCTQVFDTRAFAEWCERRDAERAAATRRPADAGYHPGPGVVRAGSGTGGDVVKAGEKIVDKKAQIGAPVNAMWTGSIVFGTLRVPVRLWRAQPTDRPSVPLKTLHRECMAPIKRVERCSECAAELHAEDKVQVFEVAKGEFVEVSRDDLPRPQEDERQTVEVEDWISLADLDPLQIEKTYYLVPADKTERAFALLHRAMLQTGAAAIARVTLRSKESLCAVYPRGSHMVLSILHIAADMTDPGELPAGADGIAVEERAFDAACDLIGRHMVRFNPFRYRDRQTDQAMAEIRRLAGDVGSVVATSAPKRRAQRQKVA